MPPAEAHEVEDEDEDGGKLYRTELERIHDTLTDEFR